MSNLKKYAEENYVPIIMDDGLDLLIETIKTNNSKTILELGTAIGYSSINIAKTSSDINIVTLERNQDLYNQAKENIYNENLQNQITMYNIDIDDFSTDKIFDFIFIDAAKSQYSKHLEKFLPNLSDDGIVLFDNISFHGMVEDPSKCISRNKRQLVRKIREFRDSVLEDERFCCDFKPDVGDGIIILRRRK